MLWPMRSVFSPLLMLSADNSLKSSFAPFYVKVTTKGGQSQALLKAFILPQAATIFWYRNGPSIRS